MASNKREPVDVEPYRVTTLGLKEAAQHVRLHYATLAQRARQGKIPGAAKPGRSWVFPIAGLDAYLNSLSPCPYPGTADAGGSTAPRNQEELEALLDLPKRKRRRDTTTRRR